MEIGIVIALAVVLVVWGIASGMQSYASAQQAEAAIQAAKAAQSANAVSGALIVLIAILIFVIVALVAFIIIAPRIRRLLRLRNRSHYPGFGGYQISRRGIDPQTLLAALEIYQMLQGQSRKQLPYRPRADERLRLPERITIDDDHW